MPKILPLQESIHYFLTEFSFKLFFFTKKGLRLMDGKVTDLQEALALTYGLHKVDVYSASWGPKDDGKHMAGPGKLTLQALKEGIKFVSFFLVAGNTFAPDIAVKMDASISSKKQTVDIGTMEIYK